MTNKENTIEAVKRCNEAIAFAKHNNFDTKQIKALNVGNIVTMLSAIAVSLADIADALTEEKTELEEA